MARGTVLTFLQDKDLAVFGCDVHGFGLSEPKDKNSRLYIAKMQYAVDDYLGFAKVIPSA